MIKTRFTQKLFLEIVQSSEILHLNNASFDPGPYLQYWYFSHCECFSLKTGSMKLFHCNTVCDIYTFFRVCKVKTQPSTWMARDFDPLSSTLW